MEETIINWLSSWYLEQCNGDWEHTYGVKIDNIDNPGWQVKIDLKDTEYEFQTCSLIKEENANDWLHYEIVECVFSGYCSPNNLSKLLEAFRKIIKSERKML